MAKKKKALKIKIDLESKPEYRKMVKEIKKLIEDFQKLKEKAKKWQKK